MRVTTTKRIIIVLFVYLYIPFLWNYGYLYRFTSHGDFAAFYSAARLVFVDHRSPYTVNAFKGLDSVFGHVVYPYVNLPPSLLVYYPLTFFRYGVAHTLMLMVNHACVLLFIYLFFFKIVRLNLSQPFECLMAALWFVYLFTFFPLTWEIFFGQIDLIVLLFLCLTWYAMKRNARSVLVALPLSVAILMKTYPVLFIPLLIARKDYRAIACVCGLLLLYIAISYLVLPHAVWGDWFVNVLPAGGYGKVPSNPNIVSPAWAWNQNINGFTSRIFLENQFSEALWPNPWLARIVPYLLSLCIVATTIGVSYFASRKLDAVTAIDLQFPLYLLVMFMVAPLTWEQHLVYALPCAFVAFNLLLSSRRNYIAKSIVMLALFGLSIYLPLESSHLKKGVLTLAISIKLYAVIVLWLYYVLEVRRNVHLSSQAQATSGLLHVG